MKVVIDISPETWEQIKAGNIPVMAYVCIEKGTPLRCVLDKMRCKIKEYTFIDKHGSKIIFIDRLNHIINEVESEGDNGTL